MGMHYVLLKQMHFHWPIIRGSRSQVRKLEPQFRKPKSQLRAPRKHLHPMKDIKPFKIAGIRNLIPTEQNKIYHKHYRSSHEPTD